ncbi:DUF2971 domain-containing protein [Rhizorhabdus sp. FW153]|uniref:DUF2971 domain-containing protein n=1 Tax=Rhizorhabdus sp. FW153 TaxID=3400216 RepID=UPI003CF5ECF7
MAKIETFARPTWLYRYRSIGAGLLDGTPAGKTKFVQEMEAILNDYVWCAHYKNMNDPMEGLYKASTKVQNHPQYSEFIRNLKNEKLSLGIASFSETWSNELMWAHYADSFQGICICYSMPTLLRGMSEENAFARIAYGNKPYYLALNSMKNDFERSRAVLSTKHLSWAYEREWRLFSSTIGKATYERGAIKAIYLGARLKNNVRETVRRMVKPLALRVHTTEADGYSIVKSRTYGSE